MDLGAPELMILVLVVLVLFGGSQLPKLAKNIGKAQKEFKSALSEAQQDDAPVAPAVAADEPKNTDVTT